MHLGLCFVKIKSYFILSLIISAIGISTISLNLNKLGAEELLQKDKCVEYNSTQKLIKVRCTDIYDNVGYSGILAKENTDDELVNQHNGNVWILRAGIVIEKEGGLIIDSK